MSASAQTSSESKPKQRVALVACLGALTGALFWFLIAYLLFYQLIGLPRAARKLEERRTESQQDSQSAGSREDVTPGPADVFILFRIMHHWINLFTIMAFTTALALLFARRSAIKRERRALNSDFLGEDEQTLLLPEDALTLRQQLNRFEPQERCTLFNRLVATALQRARANWSAQDVGAAINSQADLIQGDTESQYSMIRYLAWAIPSIGFIGTVLGIGEAMGVFGGDGGGDSLIRTAAGHLSTAFDTTFVALVLSLFLMYFVHSVQAAEDSLLVSAVDKCMRRFVLRMHIRKGN